MILETPRTILKVCDSTSAEKVANFYARNQVFFAESQPVKEADFYTAQWWSNRLTELKTQFEDDNFYQFFIFLKENESIVIGQCNISGISRGAFQACYLGYQLSEEYNGQGYMQESLKTLVNWCFIEKRLHRIMANYMPSNGRSGRLLKKLGFSVEGYARDYLYLNGSWQDHILTSQINPTPDF